MKVPINRVAILVAGVGAVGGLISMVAVNLPAGTAMRDKLRRLYAPAKVTILTLRAPSLEQSCGWYRSQGNGQRWRYFSSGDGVWAEELSPDGRSPAQGPTTATDVEARWQRCMHKFRSGHQWDWALTPIAVGYLNAT